MDPLLFARLEVLHAELGAILKNLAPVALSPSPPPAPPSAPAVLQGGYTPGKGTLSNPYVGRIEKVTFKDLEGPRGPFRIFEIHVVGGTKMGTLKEKEAKVAETAVAQKLTATIFWKERPKNGYMNYDLTSILLPGSAY